MCHLICDLFYLWNWALKIEMYDLFIQAFYLFVYLDFLL